jgi:hypothetical protein
VAGGASLISGFVGHPEGVPFAAVLANPHTGTDANLSGRLMAGLKHNLYISDILKHFCSNSPDQPRVYIFNQLLAPWL